MGFGENESVELADWQLEHMMGTWGGAWKACPKCGSTKVVNGQLAQPTVPFECRSCGHKWSVKIDAAAEEC